MEGMQRVALCIPSLIFSPVFTFKKLQLVYYVEMKMSRTFSLVYCTCFPCVLSPGLQASGFTTTTTTTTTMNTTRCFAE
jgi:Cu/Ag efflux pump CusA